MTIAQSNVRIPKRNPKILRRVRLLDLLHSNIHRKLTFVCAPAGYGKTTLMVDFAEDVDAEVFWYRILGSDTTLSVFFDNIIQAVQNNISGFGEDLLGLVTGGDESPRTLALSFVNAVEETIDQYSLLVLDDYHIVSDDPDISEFIDVLLEFLPDQLRILIGSRSVYGIPTANLYIQEQLAVISSTDLAFRSNELQELCRQYYQIDLSDDQAERIIEESEGWIIAILLALRTQSPTIEIPKILGAKEHIYQYLASDVITTLPDHIKIFLLGTSLVEEFIPTFSDYLLEITNSKDIIKEIEDLNLFLSETDDSGENTYRYHQLFAEFLQTHFSETMPEEAPKFHLRAASWFEDHDNPERAISHYIQAGEIEKAAKVMDEVAHQFYVNGKFNSLEKWYQYLDKPKDLRGLAPKLLLYAAKVKHNRDNQILSEEILDLADPLLLDRKEYRSYVNLLVTRGMFYSFSGRYQEALQAAVLAQDCIGKYKLKKYYWHQAERLKGIASYYLGDFDKAFESLENVAKTYRKQIKTGGDKGEIHDLIATLSDIGYFGISSGKIFEAQRSFREAVELSKKIRSNYLDIAMTSNNFAYLQYILGEYPEAWRYYAQAMEAAKAHQLESYITNVANGQADLLRDIGELDEARQLYLDALSQAEKIHENIAITDAYVGLAETETRSGFFNKALYYIRELARVKQEDASLPEFQARFGKVYLAMGQLDLAKENFENSLDHWGENPTPKQILIEAYYHYAQTLSLLGDQKRSLEFIKKAFQLTASLGYDQFLVIAARKDMDFLESLYQQWESPQLKSFIERAQKPLPSMDQLAVPQEVVEELDMALQVLTFGSAVVRINGEAITNQIWHSAGARAMFYFIVDQGKVTKEKIALEFWPEFSQGKVNSNFHATLWRVRNALGGKHMIVFKGNSYRINPLIDLFYDVNQFEALANRIKNSESETELRALLRQAVELYQDDYLIDIDMGWADQRRAELRTQFLDMLSQLAQIELDKNNFPEALKLYDRLITIDTYQDLYHLNKMHCLVGTGNVNAARKHFQMYSSQLQEELGLEPTSELTSLYESL